MKKPTDSGRVVGTIGAGTVGGGATTGMCQRRLPGATYCVVASACCSSTCAFLALRSDGLAGRFGGLGFRSVDFGRLAIGLRLRRGSTGFANTLTIKTIASAVAMMDSANHIRRTRRQRRPCGSWKTGESEADKFANPRETLNLSPSDCEIKRARKVSRKKTQKAVKKKPSTTCDRGRLR